MIIKALSMDNFKWLMFLWAFQKNYIGSALKKEDAIEIKFEQLFELILK